VVLVVAVSKRSAAAIMVSGLALTLAQAGDAVVGFHGGSLPTIIGPLVIALATLVCLIGFQRSLRSNALHDGAGIHG
jgi:L-lactate permease